MEHNRDIERYLKFFEDSPLHPHFRKWDLLRDFNLTFIKDGSHCIIPKNSFVFNVKGLLKQSYKTAEFTSSFIQFLLPETCWKSESISDRSSIIVMALQPTILLYLPMEKISPFLKKNKRFANDFKETLTIDYESGLSLSYYLQEQHNPLSRFTELWDIYGDYLKFIDAHELGNYICISKNKASYLMYLLKSNRLVDFEVMKQQFSK